MLFEGEWTQFVHPMGCKQAWASYCPLECVRNGWPLHGIPRSVE